AVAQAAQEAEHGAVAVEDDEVAAAVAVEVGGGDAGGARADGVTLGAGEAALGAAVPGRHGVAPQGRAGGDDVVEAVAVEVDGDRVDVAAGAVEQQAVI